MNYIKELDIKNTYTNKILKLKFSEGTNVIIGPKGGGKSTLLNLIYALYCKGKLLKETKEALQTKHLDPESVAITYSNGEIVTYKQLSNISSKDGIITQSDDIKTELHNTKKIEKAKDEFVEIIIKKRAKYIIELFEEYFKTFFDLYQLRSDNVS
jgi:ABC-type lipoprotein export system ATPase subunit